MIIKKYAVFFDTNAYRHIVRDIELIEVEGYIHNLKAIEKKKQIIPFGIITTGLELLGNLSKNESDINYIECLKGIIALSNHCYDYDLKTIRYIGQPYLHLSKLLFNRIPEQFDKSNKNLGGVISDFRIDFNNALSIHLNQNTFENLSDFIADEELRFASQIRDLVLGAKNIIESNFPNSDKKKIRKELLSFVNGCDFEDFMANAIIVAVAINLEVELDKEEIEEKVKILKVNYPAAVAFYKYVCYKIIERNIDIMSNTSKKSKWNWQWDYQISFFISGIPLDNRETILVTSDNDVIEFLTRLGYKNKVLRIGEYLSFLKETHK